MQSLPVRLICCATGSRALLNVIDRSHCGEAGRPIMARWWERFDCPGGCGSMRPRQNSGLWILKGQAGIARPWVADLSETEIDSDELAAISQVCSQQAPHRTSCLPGRYVRVRDHIGSSGVNLSCLPVHRAVSFPHLIGTTSSMMCVSFDRDCRSDRPLRDLRQRSPRLGGGGIDIAGGNDRKRNHHSTQREPNRTLRWPRSPAWCPSSMTEGAVRFSGSTRSSPRSSTSPQHKDPCRETLSTVPVRRRRGLMIAAVRSCSPRTRSSGSATMLVSVHTPWPQLINDATSK